MEKQIQKQIELVDEHWFVDPNEGKSGAFPDKRKGAREFSMTRSFVHVLMSEVKDE